MAVDVTRRPFTVGEYHRMVAAGILGENDRVELLEGEIVEMGPIGSRHAACVDRLAQLLFERFADRALVRVQNPVTLGRRSEPQPDVALVEPKPGGYARAHPRADQILLLVEVAETSGSSDRTLKLPLYARSGVPEVWLVDLEGDRIEVYRDPGTEGYRTVRWARSGEELMVATLPGPAVPVERILG